MKVLVSNEKKDFATRRAYGEIKILLYPTVPSRLEDDAESEELYEVFEDVRIAVEECLMGLSVGAEDFIASIED